MIKNVVFDLGKVLVAFDWDVLAREIGFSEEEIEIFNEKVIGDRWDEFDRGVMPEEEVIEYVKEAIPGSGEIPFPQICGREGRLRTCENHQARSGNVRAPSSHL